MRKYRALLAGAAFAALAFTAGAIAQSVATFSLTGNEVVSMAIGGPGGSSIFVPSAELRGTSGYLTTAQTSGSISLTNVTNRLVTTAVVSGALAVNAPATPFDGENFELVNASSGANTATVTFTAASGQTVTSGAIATQAQNASAEWMYVAATSTWIRMR
jgi:hypothetical protein